MEPTKEKLIHMLETMHKIRRFEQAVMQLSEQGLVGGATHLYIGQEAVATGVCSALEKADYVLSTHRGHGHCIAKGGDLKKMMAELIKDNQRVLNQWRTKYRQCQEETFTYCQTTED